MSLLSRQGDLIEPSVHFMKEMRATRPELIRGVLAFRLLQQGAFQFLCCNEASVHAIYPRVS